MNNRTKWFRWGVFSVILIALLSGCHTINSPTELKNFSEKRLYDEGNTAFKKHIYTNAIKYYEALQASYPFGPYTQQSQLDLVYAYFHNHDYAQASAAADHYIRLYPRDVHVDYAYYMKGLADYELNRSFYQRALPIDVALRDLENMRNAYRSFNTLVRRFPQSPYAPDARQRMVYMRDMLAQHELDVGKFYLRRQAFVAAANRGSYIIRHYQHAPAVEPGMGLMIDAYQALGEKSLLADTQRLLCSNYPQNKRCQSKSSA